MSASLFRVLADRFEPPRLRLDRRALLRASLAGAVASAMGCTGAAAGRDSRRRVVVVGAGFAGLACADRLVQHGHEVLVFEARERLGGRVRTLRDYGVRGVPVEAGGEFIGSNHPTWLALAQRFSLALAEVPEVEGESPVRLGGRTLSAAETRALWEGVDALTGKLATAARDALAKDQAAPVEPERAFLAADAEAVDRRSLADWLAAEELDATVRIAVAAAFEHDNGLPLGEQSLLGVIASIAGGGFDSYFRDSETWRCAAGNAALARALGEAVGADRITVSQPVTGIDPDGAGVRVSTADGGQHHADVAVLAVPPSTWARIRIDSTLLPAPLATNPPRMGDAAKYVAHATSRFWRRAGLAADACADAPLGFVWEPTARSGADTPDRAAVLIGFCGGTAARELTALDASARLNRCRAAVDALLPGFLAMRVGPPAPEPDRFVAWPAERWTLGGYSFPAPGQVTTTARALREANGPLRFCGEHCSLAFPGYMEGALASGQRVADEIA